MPSVPNPSAPDLAVIVDTEEEFDWSRPFSRSAVRVGSIAKQLLMHQVFGRHGIVPTYVVDTPVATTPSAVSCFLQYSRHHTTSGQSSWATARSPKAMQNLAQP